MAEEDWPDCEAITTGRSIPKQGGIVKQSTRHGGNMQVKKIYWSIAAIGLSVASGAQAADAERIAQLEKQLQILQEQINGLKSTSPTRSEVQELRQEVATQKKDSVVAGSLPGSFRLPGSDTSIRLYGAAELNMVHEAKGDNGANDYATFAPFIPLNGSPDAARKGQTYLHARTSRLGIEALTTTAYGPLKFKVEGDFNNDPRNGDASNSGSVATIMTQRNTNSYDFRLRHAYFEMGSWLVGQTWSTFMDGANAPETVDFNGPVGNTFIRQAQIRYTHSTKNYGDFIVAVENADSYVLDSQGMVTADGFAKVPDLIVRWDKNFSWGGVSLRALSDEFRINGALGNQSRRGSGFAASGSFRPTGSDTLSWMLTGGTGIGRYLNVIHGAAYNPGADRIEMERAAGVVLGYQHRFSDSLRANLVYGAQRTYDNAYTETAMANGFGGGRYGVNRSVSQIHVGAIWNPVKLVDVGLEYIYGQRETLIGEKGESSRLNLMLRYNLN